MRYLAFFLFLIALPASAGWEKYGQFGDEAVFYLDRSSIRKNGNLVRMMDLIDLKRRDKYGALSIRSYAEYDCKNFRYRRLTVGHFAKSMAQEGAVVFADNSPEQWRDVPNETMFSEALRLACKDH